MLARPIINLIESRERLRFVEVKSDKIKTGIMPLEMSRHKPKTPILYPTALAKFVAPILPEPTFRRSTFFMAFAKMKEKGMDPIR